MNELVNRLRQLRVVLKSGDYDGADLMRAWCAMMDAADALEKLSGDHKPLLISDFPKHSADLHLSHNGHLSSYMTAKESIEAELIGYRSEDWVSEEQRLRAIETNECWTLQWYPDTPVSFYIMSAADLGALMAAVKGSDL